MNAQVLFQALGSAGPDRERWLELLDQWPGREAFAHPDYLSLFLEPGQTAVCLFFRCKHGRAIYPLILRSLNHTAFWNGTELCDAIAPPFGYGGPFIDGAADTLQRTVVATEFYRHYEQWAQSQRVVSEYTTFSPKDQIELPYPGEVVVKMPTVVRTLDLPSDDILRSYKVTLRQRVNSAKRAGVTIEVDLIGERLSDFLAIHEETMKRTSADARYFVSREFAERLNRTLSGYYAYFVALLDGMVISTELVLISGDSTFFFRGGTYSDKLCTRANQLLKHEIILWSKEQGKRYYILGAGKDAEDPLFKYKASFAPRGVRPLRTGKWILSREYYAELVEARRAFEILSRQRLAASRRLFP